MVSYMILVGTLYFSIPSKYHLFFSFKIEFFDHKVIYKIDYNHFCDYL